jgi:hypothetical protein
MIEQFSDSFLWTYLLVKIQTTPNPSDLHSQFITFALFMANSPAKRGCTTEVQQMTSFLY